MSWLFATAYDAFMRRTEEACLGAWRRELLAPLRGSVLEIGAGTGANLPYYPNALDRLVLTEADAHMLRRLERNLLERPRDQRVEIVRASADALPFADEAFDVVVSTLVLCTVPDPARAIEEGSACSAAEASSFSSSMWPQKRVRACDGSVELSRCGHAWRRGVI